MTTTLSPWQERAWQRLMTAQSGGRLPHALLVGGPVGLGKRALARRLALHLLCSAPNADGACGKCRNCVLHAAGTHPDFLEETFELNDKGEPRKEILIAQIRRLGEKLNLTPQIAAGQVALVHPAEAMNRSAFNALLKTLEEPAPGRHLILLADAPQRLPATIRSRCQWLRLDLPERSEALAWLVSSGHDARVAGEALDAAQGNPGLASDYLAHDALVLRRAVAKDLVTLAQQQIAAIDLAVAWQDDRPAARLRFAGELVRDHLARRAGAARKDLLAAAGFSEGVDALALADWFDASLKVLAGLDAPLLGHIQLVDLLLRWQATVRA